jgi:hypothetical protein
MELPKGVKPNPIGIGEALTKVLAPETLSWSNEKSLKRRLFILSKSRNGGNLASIAFATKERLCVQVPL